MKKDIEAGDEEGIKDKETAIIELGSLLAATKQADGSNLCAITYCSLAVQR